MTFTHINRCEHCGKTWAVRYDVASIVFNFFKVQNQLASAELECAMHKVDCVMRRVYVPIKEEAQFP